MDSTLKGFLSSRNLNTQRTEIAEESSMSDNLEQRLHDLSIGTGSKTPLAAIARINALEAQLKTVLDRETSIFRYYDAKLDAADAQLKTAVWALTDIGDGEPEWPDEPARELDWCRDRANRTIAKIKGEQP